MALDRETQKPTMDEAISRLGGSELATPNRYWVAFSLPPGVAESNVNSGVAWMAQNPNAFTKSVGDIGFMCAQMSFPARSFQTVESRHIGTPFRIPYTSQYTDVSFTFHCSADLRERKYFEIWQQMIVNVPMNSMNFYSEYVSQVHLMQLDKEGNVTYQNTLIEAYPISLDDVNYSYASKDEVTTCSVSMSYRHWINPLIV